MDMIDGRFVFGAHASNTMAMIYAIPIAVHSTLCFFFAFRDS